MDMPPNCVHKRGMGWALIIALDELRHLVVNQFLFHPSPDTSCGFRAETQTIEVNITGIEAEGEALPLSTRALGWHHSP